MRLEEGDGMVWMRILRWWLSVMTRMGGGLGGGGKGNNELRRRGFRS